LRTFASCLEILELSRIVDYPVIRFLVPIGYLLVFSIVFRRNHILDNHVLKLELVGQFEDGVVHVVSLSVEVVPNTLQLFAGLLVLAPQFLQLVRLKL